MSGETVTKQNERAQRAVRRALVTRSATANQLVEDGKANDLHEARMTLDRLEDARLVFSSRNGRWFLTDLGLLLTRAELVEEWDSEWALLVDGSRREERATWAIIGAVLGISRQAAHQRFANSIDDDIAEDVEEVTA